MLFIILILPIFFSLVKQLQSMIFHCWSKVIFPIFILWMNVKWNFTVNTSMSSSTKHSKICKYYDFVVYWGKASTFVFVDETTRRTTAIALELFFAFSFWFKSRFIFFGEIPTQKRGNERRNFWLILQFKNYVRKLCLVSISIWISFVVVVTEVMNYLSWNYNIKRRIFHFSLTFFIAVPQKSSENDRTRWHDLSFRTKCSEISLINSVNYRLCNLIVIKLDNHKMAQLTCSTR